MIRGGSYHQQKTSNWTTTNLTGLFLPPSHPLFVRIVILFQTQRDQCYQTIKLRIIPWSFIASSTKPPLAPCTANGKKMNSFICPQPHIWASRWHQWGGLCQMWASIRNHGCFPPSDRQRGIHEKAGGHCVVVSECQNTTNCAWLIFMKLEVVSLGATPTSSTLKSHRGDNYTL